MRVLFIYLLCLITTWVPNTGYAKTYAVIVGVSRYDNLVSDLRYAADDAQLFYNYLKSNVSSSDLVVIKNEDATKETVLKNLKEKFLLATESDEVIFFFSGHGGPGRFLCFDSPEGGNYLTHDEVKAAFKASKANTKICFADACFSGSIKKTDYKKSIGYSSTLKSVNDFELIVFMSSQPWQTSQEKGFLQQGVFTYYLIQALDGTADADKNGGITAKELYVYVRNQVMKITDNKQTPIMFGKFNPQRIIKRTN